MPSNAAAWLTGPQTSSLPEVKAALYTRPQPIEIANKFHAVAIYAIDRLKASRGHGLFFQLD